MVRLDGDHINWILVVILVTLALLLAMVSSTAYSAVQQADPQAVARADQARHFRQVAAQERKEVRTPSEVWYVARELYQAGRVAEARRMFEKVLAVYPYDPAARMWAGMAAYRAGDRATAIRHWSAVWCDEAPVLECGVWPAVALAAAELESGRPDRAARFIVPLERGDYGIEFADHPVVSFYAALVYEQLASAAPKYRDAVEESLAEKFSLALASSDGSQMVSPNSQSWLIFLTKRALRRTIPGARSLDRAAPVVPESATVEPSFAPIVEELLECLGSTDFASQARRKLRALELYQSPPNRRPEIFDDPELIKRGRFIA
jgi:tetratricopeptide (TPR) repeat protein